MVNTDTTLTIGTPSTSESGIKEYRFYVSTSETSLIGGSAGNHYNAVFSVTDDAGATATITRGSYVQSDFAC